MKTDKKTLDKITVEYLGIFLEVEGVYYKGTPQTWDEPKEPDTFEVYDVYAGDVKITDLIKDEIIEELDELACEEIKNQ